MNIWIFGITWELWSLFLYFRISANHRFTSPKKKNYTKKLHDIYLSTTLHSLLFIPFGADFNPTTVTRPTCGEHQDRVVPEPPLLQRQGDVAHRLVHGGHHAGVRPAGVVFDETVGGHIALRHLQRRVDGLQCHIEEERLQDTGRGNF